MILILKNDHTWADSELCRRVYEEACQPSQLPFLNWVTTYLTTPPLAMGSGRAYNLVHASQIRALAESDDGEKLAGGSP
jgi:hypothetical protein